MESVNTRSTGETSSFEEDRAVLFFGMKIRLMPLSLQDVRFDASLGLMVGLTVAFVMASCEFQVIDILYRQQPAKTIAEVSLLFALGFLQVHFICHRIDTWRKHRKNKN